MIILQEEFTRADVAKGYGATLGGMGGALLGRLIFSNSPALQGMLGNNFLSPMPLIMAGSFIGNKLLKNVAGKLISNPKKKIDPKNKFHRIGALLNKSDIYTDDIQKKRSIIKAMESQKEKAKELGYGRVGQTMATVPPIGLASALPVVVGATNPKNLK